MSLSIPFSLFLLLSISVKVSSVCSHSRDCDDHNPATLDFCVIRYSFCLSVPISDHAQSRHVIRQFDPAPFKLTTLRKITKEANAKPLSLEDKVTVITAAKDVLENVNPHIFLYQNLYNYNISHQLSNLKEALIEKQRQNKTSTNVSFHRSMRKIFAGLNDYHTVYIPPPSISVSLAFLGFYTRQFFSKSDRKQRRYVVNDIPADFRSLFNLEGSPFQEGVELLTYNEIPIDEAVKKLGRQGSGSNFAARVDNGAFLLSFRFLAVETLPIRRSVTIGYREKNGKSRVIKIPWLFMNIPGGTIDMIFGTPASPLRPQREEMFNAGVKGARLYQRSHTMVLSDHNLSLKVAERRKTKIQVKPRFQALFGAEILNTKAGRIGRLILPSFNSTVTDELAVELARVIKLLPKRGLILDARRNAGGQGDYAKAVSELVSDKTFEDQPEVARATDLMRDIYFADGFLDRIGPNPANLHISLRNALATALRIKERFTGPYGSIFVRRPRLLRVFYGPVVSVVDGLTYSAGDIFATLQVDQNVSLLVGTSDNTGAGGASTTAYTFLSFLAPKALKPLPGGVDFLTAISRFYRLGLQRGAIVENFGVKPDIRYYPTYNDATMDDRDLFDFLGEKLVSMGA